MRFLDRPDGLHPMVPFDEYGVRCIDVVSKSGLEELARSPLHFQTWCKAPPEEPAPALAFGKAFHHAILEPDVFASTYAVMPDFGDCRKKENKAARDAWRDENAGRLALTIEDAEAIHGMEKAVRTHPLAGRMIRDGIPELSALWTDKATGLRCKTRTDHYVEQHAMLLDLKSTRDASHDAFRRDMFNLNYHWQFALYREGFAVLGAPAKHFVFVAVEKTPPYGVGIFTLDLAGVSVAYDRVRRLMEIQAQCLREDSWPGYTEHIQTIDAPPWAA